MKISVFGLGYVGSTTAGCLVRSGHHVVGVDSNESKVHELNAGKSPVAEPGLEELLKDGIAAGRLKGTVDPVEALRDSVLALVCVGTPSTADGTHNMTHVADVSRQIATALKNFANRRTTVVYRSTMRPGTTEEVVAPIFRSILGSQMHERVELVYNPEFLREASAINDYFHPPKIVIGTVDGKHSYRMDELYSDIDAPIFYTRFGVAEITKFVDNSWHATKVAFTNEIGRICVALDLDPQEVNEIFVSDTKLNISPYYMRPGGAFGGSCLPKDVRALQHLAGDLGAGAVLVDSLIRSNEAHKHFVFAQCVRNLSPGARVLVVGLAFKADSDDLRESPNVDLVGKLLRAGYHVDVFDPGIQAERLIGQNLGYAYVHLPNLASLLVSEENIDIDSYDLVVDMNGRAKSLPVPADRLLSIHRLRPSRRLAPIMLGAAQ